MTQPPSKPSSKPSHYEDEWGTSQREGYTDIPDVDVEEVRARSRKPPARTAFLEGFGGFLMVGAFCWGTYLLAKGMELPDLLHMGIHSPIGLCGFGVVVSIVGRFFRR